MKWPTHAEVPSPTAPAPTHSPTIWEANLCLFTLTDRGWERGRRPGCRPAPRPGPGGVVKALDLKAVHSRDCLSGFLLPR